MPSGYQTADATVAAYRAAAVTPNDSTDIENTRGLFVGIGGSVTVLPYGNTASILFSNVPSGSVLPVQVKRVYSTGTTASNIVALY